MKLNAALVPFIEFGKHCGGIFGAGVEGKQG